MRLGGAVADCGSVVACAGSSHPVHRRPRQSRADAAHGGQVVRTVARSTWTPWTTPAPRCVGRRRTGWELRWVVVEQVLQELVVSRSSNGCAPQLQCSEKLRDECEEARRCFTSKAFTATAAMVRRVLEGLCLDQAATTKPLVNALKQLAADEKLDGRLFEWAQELRGLSNHVAHHTGIPVQRQDAHDPLLLTEAILNCVYALPMQFEAFRRRRAGEPPVLPPPLAGIWVQQAPPAAGVFPSDGPSICTTGAPDTAGNHGECSRAR
ncbi:DUF4145 domain-containing protein [Streptomyces sp. NPDC048196]|uniref:DUF4145 domain-containing protein n=1 Tax=Streptomyces sp. NPDC048196 TaxID=3154712 RepID=UPI0033F54E83